MSISNIDTSNIDTSNIDTYNIDTYNIEISNIDTSNIEISKPTGLNEPTSKEGNDNLPAKFFKNMVFGYWFLLRLKEDNVICDDVYNKALGDFLKPFASNADKNSLYLAFETDFKMLSKDLKKMVKDHNKPIKVNKSKTEKPPKKLKDKDKNTDKDDIVSRIVDAALTSTTEPVKPKRKYSRKKNIALGELTTETEAPKELENETETKTPKEPKTKTKATKAPKAPKEPETETKVVEAEAEAEAEVKVVEAKVVEAKVVEAKVVELETKELETEEEEEEEEEESELEVQLFTFKDGFNCLYNPDDLSLYDTLSHEPITTHSLQRISLPNNIFMLLDNHNNAYL
jgi:hypothetical protein